MWNFLAPPSIKNSWLVPLALPPVIILYVLRLRLYHNIRPRFSMVRMTRVPAAMISVALPDSCCSTSWLNIIYRPWSLILLHICLVSQCVNPPCTSRQHKLPPWYKPPPIDNKDEDNIMIRAVAGWRDSESGGVKRFLSHCFVWQNSLNFVTNPNSDDIIQ